MMRCFWREEARISRWLLTIAGLTFYFLEVAPKMFR